MANVAVVLMVGPPRLRRHPADRPPADLPRIDVPTLMVHGAEDRILPIDSTARRLPELIADCTLIEIDDGPTCTGSALSHLTSLTSHIVFSHAGHCWDRRRRTAPRCSRILSVFDRSWNLAHCETYESVRQLDSPARGDQPAERG